MNCLKRFVFLVFITLIISCNFAPGSYPYAEEYEIDVSESILIEAIESFKENNPQYIVPERSQLNDGRSNIAGQEYWYHVYFYYRKENELVKCWTRPNQTGTTTLAFVGINIGLELGNWKVINKDFSRSENKEEKRKFEERILKGIKEEL